MKFESTRRKALQGLQAGDSTHPGLWLDKFITSTNRAKTEAKAQLINEVIALTRNEKFANRYESFYNRLHQALVKSPLPIYYANATTHGRLSVGLGESSVLETSIALHHTYGVPYIPGSALKGIASHFAARYLGKMGNEEEWRQEIKDGKTLRGAYQKLIFGDTEESGLVIFFDAHPVPERWCLKKDVITVHHPDYYQTGEKPPADWDSPNPIPFLTAHGTFTFLLGLAPVSVDDLEPGESLLKLAAELLKRALEEEGVGAKTSLGYGTFKFLENFKPLTGSQALPSQEVTETSPVCPQQ